MDPLDLYGNAIAGIESGGSYGLLGPPTKSGDRAYGKYQVMGENIPEWTKEAIGQSLTPQQFLASPQAQDAVFKTKFSGYVEKYGPEGAARAWFAGPGNMNNPNAKDSLGTTVAGYADKFNAAIGGGKKMDWKDWFGGGMGTGPTAGIQNPGIPGATTTNNWQNAAENAGNPMATASATGNDPNWLQRFAGNFGMAPNPNAPVGSAAAMPGQGQGMSPGQMGMGMLAQARPHPAQQQQMQMPQAQAHIPQAGNFQMPQLGILNPTGGSGGTGGGMGGSQIGDPRLLGILRQYGLV